MARFYKIYWKTFPTTLVLLILSTLISIKIFTPLSSTLQDNESASVMQRHPNTLLNQTSFENLIKTDQFFYLEVNNRELLNPLIYHSEQTDIYSRLFRLLFSPPTTTIVSVQEDQTIHYIHKNPTIIHSVINNLFSFYFIIIFSAFVYAYISVLSLKFIEKKIIQ